MKVTVNVNERGQGTVSLDGHDVSKFAAGIQINAEIGKLSTVVLRLVNVEVEFSAPAVLAAARTAENFAALSQQASAHVGH